jgi:hypothetical protein
MTTKPKWKLGDLPVTEEKRPANAWGGASRSKQTSVSLLRLIQNARADAAAESIDDWFFTPQSDDVSPYLFAKTVAETFLEEVQKTADLEIALSPPLFTKKICAAITAYVYYEQIGRQVGVPRELQKSPRGWTAQTHAIWQDYLESVYFTNSFFERFWRRLPPTLLEEAYPQIRGYLQSIFPYFIKYDETLLVDHALIARNSEGEYVDPADADVEEQEEHPYD